eukprot:11901430-Alexandrium_andersonii.AAC.1
MPNGLLYEAALMRAEQLIRDALGSPGSARVVSFPGLEWRRADVPSAVALPFAEASQYQALVARANLLS